jgi:hypothetical protein
LFGLYDKIFHHNKMPWFLGEITMNDKSPKQISRRDAIKILGAVAGASVLANLPSKWNKPKLTTGVLPAHAQTSGPVLALVYALTCDANIMDPVTCNDIFTSGVTISPPVAGIPMQYNVSVDSGGTLILPNPAIGTALTDGSGLASVTCIRNILDGTWTIVWGFANPAQGSGSCTQTAFYGCP